MAAHLCWFHLCISLTRAIESSGWLSEEILSQPFALLRTTQDLSVHDL